MVLPTGPEYLIPLGRHVGMVSLHKYYTLHTHQSIGNGRYFLYFHTESESNQTRGPFPKATD